MKLFLRIILRALLDTLFFAVLIMTVQLVLNNGATVAEIARRTFILSHVFFVFSLVMPELLPYNLIVALGTDTPGTLDEIIEILKKELREILGHPSTELVCQWIGPVWYFPLRSAYEIQGMTAKAARGLAIVFTLVNIFACFGSIYLPMIAGELTSWRHFKTLAIISNATCLCTMSLYATSPYIMKILVSAAIWNERMKKMEETYFGFIKDSPLEKAE